ncbi:MAG: hypothetical protein MJZ38_07050 [archaeon]|nr:hypothetical protein [archaeon]
MALHDPTHLFEGEISDSTRRRARIISVVTQPQVFSLVLYAIVCLIISDLVTYLEIYGLCVFFGCIFPIIEVLYYSKKFANKDGDIVKKEDRFMPLLLGTISYVLGVVALWAASAPWLLTVLFVAYSVVTFSIMLISPYWKISIHACGMIGPTMAITYVFFPWGALLLILVPFICWSRYVLRKHTPAQMVGGIVLGFVETAIIMAVLL